MVAAAEQVQMHRDLYQQERGKANEQAAKGMLETSRMIYVETVKGYNNCLRKPANRFPGLVMGFRVMTEKEL